jgi:hypothetical protein
MGLFWAEKGKLTWRRDSAQGLVVCIVSFIPIPAPKGQRITQPGSAGPSTHSSSDQHPPLATEPDNHA